MSRLGSNAYTNMAQHKALTQNKDEIIKRYTDDDMPEDETATGIQIIGTPVSSSDAILGSHLSESFNKEVTSWCPSSETAKGYISDGVYIQAYNSAGTEFVMSDNEAAKKFIDGCNDAPTCSSVIKYSGLSGATTTAFKQFLIDDSQAVYGNNNVKSVSNENIKSFYIPLSNGDADTEFKSTQTSNTGVIFNQTMILGVPFKSLILRSQVL